jgi:hypothetical protein
MKKERSEVQRRFWEVNRDRILMDYDGGFGVVDYLQFKYFKTKADVYEKFPVLAGNPSFGSSPLLVDISEEQWDER